MHPLVPITPLIALVAASSCASSTADLQATDSSAHQNFEARGWLNWRGPGQNGVSPETGLIEELTLDGEGHLWSYPIAGRGTPVISNGRVYGLGYEGEGELTEEVLFCLDETSGELLWEHRDSDFLSDIIYRRYGIGSPTVDPETGNVFSMTAAGLLHSFSADGEMLWEVSMGETLGRLTFPNGRTGAPLIVGDLVIIHFIFAAWGRDFGPARDRFFAFDKESGEVVWGSTPGGPPKDSTFSMPVVEYRDGSQRFYAGLGGGHAVAVELSTGRPIWRFPMAVGGVNSSMLIHGDRLIAVHGRENLDSSVIGRMVALDLNAEVGEDGVLGPDAELWRSDQVAFTSSPILVGDRVYLTNQTGDLVCIGVDDGQVHWHEKLGPDQLHASPVAADGKLYIPLNNGSFYILKPGADGVEILDRVQLAGACLAAPAIANGQIYVQTTDRLYCFGKHAPRSAPIWPVASVTTADFRPATELQLVPADATVRVGDPLEYEVRQLDDRGRRVALLESDEVELLKPAVLTGPASGVGVVKATSGELVGAARVRVVPAIPFEEDFEGVVLDKGGDAPFASPPGHWLGGAIKWKVIEREGTQVIARRLENPLFQRTMSFIGHPDDSGYTAQIDFLSDGNRRSMCAIGMVNQRYLIVVKGNYQEIEVSSNMEHLKVSAPFKMKVGQWYRLKTRVDMQPDGSALVRARAWPRDETEPADWTIEVRDPNGHTNGAFGLYAFTPQSRFTAYIDNITVTPNE
jgi:outer membrane protein assembly factor BamB